MQTKTFVEAEGPIRTWARGQTALTSVVGASGIFFGAPKARPLPVITMSRIGGSPVLGETPIDSVTISFDVWGRTKQEASQLAAVLASLIESLQPGTLLDASLRCKGASIVLFLWRPDTSADPPIPRYVVDATFSVVAV